MTATIDDKALRRRFRRLDLSKEDQNFLRLLATFGLFAWCVILYGQTLPSRPTDVRREEPIQVAQVRIKPPPPPEEKKEEPKPEPLPPRQAEEKPDPAPAPKVASKPAATAAKPKAPQKRSVASMGLLSMLSSAQPRAEAASQRIGPSLHNIDFREARDLAEDVGSLTGTVGARQKATVGEMVAGLPRGTGTQVVLEGRVVTPISGPGAPSVSGEGGGASGRTLTEIRNVVSSYIAGLKYLYDRELKKRPALHGKLTVEFVIAPGGSVIETRLVQSALDHPALESAILSRIRGWKFPNKPGDSTRVTFPFDFVAPTG
ncbi:MAG: TonB family protein [Candidatus Binatia bacterium]